MSAQSGVPQYRQAYREATEVIASLADPTQGSPGFEAAPHGAEVSAPRFRTAAVGAVLNLRGYLAACETLYDMVFAVLETLQEEHGSPPRILDAGGSFGAFGLALARIGMPVVVWERFGELGSRAELVIAALDRAGARVVICKPGKQPPAEVAAACEFDLIVCLALHRLTQAATAVATASSELLAPGGELFLGVANQDFWPAPLRRLRGKGAREFVEGVVALADIVTTRAELVQFLDDSGLQPVAVSHANYTPRGLGAPVQQLLLDNVMRVCPRWRETMLARAIRKGG